MLIALALIWAVVLANICGFFSVIVGFTKFRHRRLALITALVAIVGSVGVSVCLGRPVKSLAWSVYAACWLPAPLGIVGFVRWSKKEHENDVV